MIIKVAKIKVYQLSYILAVMEITAIVRVMKGEKSNISIIFLVYYWAIFCLNFRLEGFLNAFS